MPPGPLHEGVQDLACQMALGLVGAPGVLGAGQRGGARELRGWPGEREAPPSGRDSHLWGSFPSCAPSYMLCASRAHGLTHEPPAPSSKPFPRHLPACGALSCGADPCRSLRPLFLHGPSSCSLKVSCPLCSTDATPGPCVTLAGLRLSSHPVTLSLDVGLVGKAFCGTWGSLRPGQAPCSRSHTTRDPSGKSTFIVRVFQTSCPPLTTPAKTGLREAAPWSQGQLCPQRGSQSLEGRGGCGAGSSRGLPGAAGVPGTVVPAARGTVLGMAPAPMNLGVCCPRLSVGPGPAREEHQGGRGHRGPVA